MITLKDAQTIITMGGDGIGKIVLPEALRVLEAVKFNANYIQADIGWECWKKGGNPLPNRTIGLLRKHKIGLFGAITSKPKSAADKELDSELQNKGLTYFSPIVTMRQMFNLDICIRPCRSFEGNPLNQIRRGPNGKIMEPMVDVVIFRQNTEGLYSGVEWTNPPPLVLSALKSHLKFKPYINVPPEDLAVSCRIFTRAACKRIIIAAFEYAKKFGYKSVTVCEKPNVIRETSGMMLECAKIIQEKYPKIQLWDTNIDAQMMWLSKNPEDYGIIVAGNMFGDIASDGFAGVVGGLGFAASANIGEEVAVFEPTHGSAPKYADYEISIVNPIASILSAAMMLEHIGEEIKAQQIRDAIAAVIKEGKVRTYDMMKLKGCPEVIDQGAASTSQMTDAIIDKLNG